MNRRPTRDDVAKLAGVSGATVSYVINDKTSESIQEETRQRVWKAINELGYVPNRAAKALATGRTNLIAVWVPSIHEPYYARILHHLQKLLSHSDYGMMVAYNSKSGNGSIRIENPVLWPFDGVIAVDLPGRVRSVKRKWANMRMAMVSMGFLCDTSTDAVQINLHSGATSGLEHLKSQGCHRIAYVVPSSGFFDKEPRLLAYREFLHNMGVKSEEIRLPEHERETALAVVTEYINCHGCPDGIYCYNDDIAIGVHKALRKLGLRMPDDVALVGNDGIIETEYVEPELSTVSYPTEEMCEIGWCLLLERIANPDLEIRRHNLESTLLERASSCRKK